MLFSTPSFMTKGFFMAYVYGQYNNDTTWLLAQNTHLISNFLESDYKYYEI